MFKNKVLFIFFIFFVCLSVINCSLSTQLRSYTQYYFHDFKIEDNSFVILFSKEKYSPKVSLTAAMMNEMSTNNSYSLLSYSLLAFDRKIFEVRNSGDLNLLWEKNIIKEKRVEGLNPHMRGYVIDKKRLLLNYDIVNFTPCTSLISIDNSFQVEHVTCRGDIRNTRLSFDRNQYYYILDNRLFVYHLQNKDSQKRTSELASKNSVQKFENSKYIANNGVWFLNRVGEDSITLSYKYELFDLEKDSVISRFLSKYRNFQDFRHSNPVSMLLAYSPHLGLEIIDIKGNKLYKLQDKSLSIVERAVFHKDKVYAAGITTKEGPLGKKDYIEIIQWDYKNDSVIKKYYPCDSPELEM